MQSVQPLPELPPRKAVPIQAEDLSFAYPGEALLFSGLSFTLRPGQIIGVTAPVACGKSTLGRVFLCESPYGGHLRFGDRELRDVTFGYDEQETVLRHLSFQVTEGEQVTLTGRTGAGKSTVFKLLLGLYAPQKGTVLLQGVLASEIPPAERRKLFGCVEQSFHRVPGTVRDQITLYDPAVTEEQVQTAVRLAGLDEAVGSLEQGLDTPCTPGIFSQGQWQLLSIARAVAADPKLLLLDEITANLDAETEHAVLLALRRASSNRTVISISHRTGADMGRLIPVGPAETA